jgi:hypothetical protein
VKVFVDPAQLSRQLHRLGWHDAIVCTDYDQPVARQQSSSA